MKQEGFDITKLLRFCDPKQEDGDEDDEGCRTPVKAPPKTNEAPIMKPRELKFDDEDREFNHLVPTILLLLALVAWSVAVKHNFWMTGGLSI